MSALEQGSRLADANHYSYDEALYYRVRPEEDF
jgi:hypothetical protein